MSTARGDMGVAAVGDRVVVVGGENSTTVFKQVEVYEVKARTWWRGPDLPTPRHGLGVAVVKDALYACAGGTAIGTSVTATCEVLTLR